MFSSFLDKVKGDKVIWLIVIFLTMISMAAVYSSSGILAIRNDTSFTKYLLKHGFFVLSGLGLIYVTHLIPYREYAKYAKIAFYACIPLLLYTAFFGEHINGASRWVKIPGIGLQFQTSDLAKLILMVYVARILSLKQDKISSFKEAFIPAIIPIGIYCIIIMKDNFSTAALIALVCILLLFLGGIELKQLFGVGFAGISIIVILFLLAIKLDLKQGRIQTWKGRIENFASVDLDKMVGNNVVDKEVHTNTEKSIYALEQADYAQIGIATAAPIPKGPGNSVFRNFLPHPYSDFIFAIIIEEYGILGAVLIVLLYLILLYRGIRIMLLTPGKFGALLAGGLTLMLVIQAFIHMAVNVSLLPTTGQTLPLISMGGTSILFTAASIGIILSVSRYTEELKPKLKTKVSLENI